MKFENVLDDIINYLKNIKEIKSIYLFGSRARGDAKKCSDIDLAIETINNLSFRKRREIKDFLDQLSRLYTIDLVFLDKVENDFKNKIKKEGIKLYEKK